MKKYSKILGQITLACLVLIACENPPQEASQSTEENQDSTQLKKVDSVKNETGPVLNANLATAADMASIGLPEDLLAQILEARPFLSMIAFDSLLMDYPDREAVYQQLFVPMNLNTAAEADFKLIPGVGDRMAHEFEEYRPYANLQQFRLEIGKYVDDAMVAQYEQYVFVPIELNTATEAAIKDLPGVGERMAHEFLEYRPYANLQQFRKEIGKYVDEKELARLERLVYLDPAP